MKDVIKEIKNTEGKTIEYQYLSDFYYKNEDNSRKIDIFKTLNTYKRFEYVKRKR